jgi:hypothetical protein
MQPRSSIVFHLLLIGLTSVWCSFTNTVPAQAVQPANTDLMTSFARPGWFNVDLRVNYQRSVKRGAIHREGVGSNSFDIPLLKELQFRQVRHILSIRQDTTFWKALQLYIDIPIILSDERQLDFDQNDGDSCLGSGPNASPEDNCVTPGNSTLVHDGLLMEAANMSPTQVAVAGPNQIPGGYLLPRRSGLDQIHLGLAGTPLSQERDIAHPTWVIGFEARLGVGTPMEYDPLRPLANTSVGQGIHQFKWWTSISRRFQYFEPWMSFYYMLPVAKGDSLYESTTFPNSGQTHFGPMQRGGGEVGVEIVPWQKPTKKQRISVELSARLEGVFEGRDYSEMWEVFANNPKLAGPCRLAANSLEPGRWNNGTYCASPNDFIPYPGITDIESYAIFGGTLAVVLDFTRYLRLRLGVSLDHEQQHFITYGNAGHSDNTMGTIDIVNQPKESQIDPLFRPLIDLVGHRFQVADTTIFNFFFSLTGQY